MLSASSDLFLSRCAPQKLRSLSRGSINDAKSQLGCFPLELFNLQLAVLRLVEFRSLVDVLHPVTEHAVDQSSQLGGHGLDRNGCPEFGSQSSDLRSQIGLALS